MELPGIERGAKFQPVRVGRRLLVLPAWLDVSPESEVIPIRLNLGEAFGNGAHPTTRLCLTALERHLTPGAFVLDLGTGTGILGIAAAKLGAGSVLAVDIDPEAVRVARKNVEANLAADKMRVEQGSCDTVLAGRWSISQFHLVVANILTNVIVDLFEQGLAETVSPGGLIILSGILRTQILDIRASLQWHGMSELAVERLEDWVCVIAKH